MSSRRNALRVLACAAATAAFCAQVRAQLVTDGLVTRLESDVLTLSGSNVTSWTDQSPLGTNSATGGVSPTYVEMATPSGAPAVLFNGSNQYLSIAGNSSFDTGTRTVYVLFKPSSSPNQARLINAAYSDVDQGPNTTISYNAWSSIANGTTFRGQGRDTSNGFVAATTASGATSTSQFYIGETTYDAGSGNINAAVIDESDNRVTATATGANSVPSGSIYVNLGVGAGLTSGTLANYYGGQIAAVLVYNRVLSSTEQASVESYLRTKYVAPAVTEFTWDGGGANANLSTAANWVGDVAPTLSSLSSDLTFAGTTNLSPTIAGSSAVAGRIKFAPGAGNFTLGGNALSLLGASRGVLNASGTTQTLSNSTLTINSGNFNAARGDIDVNAVISGADAINKTGSGTLVLGNSGNNFTGTTTVTDGTVAAASAGALGASSGTLAASGALNTGRYFLSGNVDVAQNTNFATRGGGTASFAPDVVSTGTVNFTNTINITNGGSSAYTIVGFESDGGKLTLSGPVLDNLKNANSANLYLSGSGEGEVSGQIKNGTGTGDFGVVKLGTGTWTLSNAGNTYTGNTSVIGGTLKILNAPIYSSISSQPPEDPGDDTLRSTISVEAAGTLDLSSQPDYLLQLGQTLRGKGYVNETGTMLAYDDDIIKPGQDSANGTGTLTLSGGLRIWNRFAAPSVYNNYFASNSNLHFRLGSGANDVLNVAGNLDFTTDTGAIQFNISPVAGLLEPGTYRVINYGSKSGSNSYAVNLIGGNDNYRAPVTIDDSQSGHIDVIVPANISMDLTWKGDGSANAWNVKGDANWNNNTQQFYYADKVTFDDSSTNTTVNITSPVYPGSITVNSSQDYTIISDGTFNGIAGSGKLIKTGSGNLTMTNTQASTVTFVSFDGSWEIQNGTISYAYVGLLPNNGIDRIILNGGALKYTGTTNANTVRMLSMGPNGGILDGSGTIGMSLSGTNPMNMIGTGDRTLHLTGTSAGTNILGALLNDPAGGGKVSVVKDGPSLWTLTNADSAFSGGVTVNAGTLSTPRIAAGAVSLNGGQLTLTSKSDEFDPAITSVVSSIGSSGGVANPGGALDIANNNLVVDYTGTSAGSDVRQLVRAGVNSGKGIISSTAAAGQLIGFAEASSLGIGSFGGQSVDGTAIVAKVTAPADANLDGVVNTADFTRMASGFGSTSAIWGDGDFNYDGVVNALDFNVLASNYGAVAAAPVLAPSLGSVVPEPAGVAALALIGFFARRRRA